MFEIILYCIGILFMCLGFLGCFIYKIPGPLLNFIGILIIQYGTDYEPFTTEAIIICGVLVVLCKIIEKLSPKLVNKIYEFGKGEKIGTTIGSFIGLLIICGSYQSLDFDYSPVMGIVVIAMGLLLIPFIFSIIGGLVVKKDFSTALKSGTSSFVNFLLNTLIQLAVCGYCIYTLFNS